VTERGLGDGRNLIVQFVTCAEFYLGQIEHLEDRRQATVVSYEEPSILGPTKASQVGVNVKSALVGFSTFTELCIVNLFHKNKL